MGGVNPPVCKAGAKWVSGRLGKGCLAPFTGADWRAFQAFFHLVELLACSDLFQRPHVIAAMRSTLLCMQPQCRSLAKAGIPHVLDWGDEETLWAEIWGVVRVTAEADT
jgi:hypothetical protein